MKISAPTDLAGLDRNPEISSKDNILKVGKNSQKVEIRKAAEEFEAIFMEIVLKSMRESVNQSGLINGGNGESIFRSMLDSEYAKSMSSQNMTGIATAIEKHLTGLVDQTTETVDRIKGQAVYKDLGKPGVGRP